MNASPAQKTTPTPKRRARRLALCAALAAALALAAHAAWSTTALTLTTYTVASPHLPAAFGGLRIAHISDLHNTEFGEGNGELLALLREAAPDIIVITGDLIDSRHTDTAVALAFAESAARVAPCLYVPGNHESRVADYGEFAAALTEAGVVVLENATFTLECEGGTLAFVGLLDPSFRPARAMPAEEYVRESLDALMGGGCEGGVREGGDAAVATADAIVDDEAPSPAFTIVLAHRPEFFATYARGGAHLTLSGHTHGGQIRLPLIGAVFAPNQGFFPQYSDGHYTRGEAHLIISRGLGNSRIPFRVNNPPELVLVVLQSS